MPTDQNPEIPGQWIPKHFSSIKAQNNLHYLVSEVSPLRHILYWSISNLSIDTQSHVFLQLHFYDLLPHSLTLLYFNKARKLITFFAVSLSLHATWTFFSASAIRWANSSLRDEILLLSSFILITSLHVKHFRIIVLLWHFKQHVTSIVF